MKITNTGTPQSATSFTPQPSNSAARERAINALLGNPAESAAQSTPVSNPSSISPEETSAVIPPTSKAEAAPAEDESQVQKSTNEDSSKAATSEETPLSAQYAHLARKEKALRAQQQELKRVQEEIQRQKDEMEKAASSKAEPDLSQYIPKERLSKETLAVLNEMGITYDQLSEQALQQPDPIKVELMAEIKGLRDELNALKGAQESTKKNIEEQQVAAYEQAKHQLLSDTQRLVASDPAFEIIKATGSEDQVVQLIVKTFNEDKIMMSVDEAAREVEQYLEEEYGKLVQLSKLQAKFKPAASTAGAPAQNKGAAAPAQPQGMKTLTNAISAQRPTSARERAIAAFEGKLNK